MTLFESIKLGLSRHPWRFITAWLLSFSAMWTMIESFDRFVKEVIPTGLGPYLLLLLLAVPMGIYRVYPLRSIVFKLGNTATSVRVLFGDLFDQKGYLAIPVNEYFDSELGQPVAKKSLHGIVVARIFSGPAGFDAAVKNPLAGKTSTQVPRPKGGKTAKYAIGTAAAVSTPEAEGSPSRNLLLFALCHTDIDDFRASTRVPDLWKALAGLFEETRVVAAGKSLSLPLVGGGVSKFGVPPAHLLQLILLAISEESKKREICKEINIVLHESSYEAIDLASVRDNWR